MGIQVISAIYGPTGLGTPAKPNVGVDVTAACQKLVDTDQHDIFVWFTTFGIEDPDPDVVKLFGILYRENGKTQTRFAADTQRVHLHN